jgi:hypothetical protein
MDFTRFQCVGVLDNHEKEYENQDRHDCTGPASSVRESLPADTHRYLVRSKEAHERGDARPSCQLAQ